MPKVLHRCIYKVCAPILISFTHIQLLISELTVMETKNVLFQN